MEIFSAECDLSKEEMFRKISEHLYTKGYVKESYLESLLHRESLHPTGLKVEDLISIAIPHTDVEHVNKQTMVVVKNAHSHFDFQRMDEPSETLSVNLALLLVVKEPDGYVNFLAALTSLFQEDSFIDLLSASPPDQICKSLVEKLDKFNLVYEGDLC